MENGGSKFFENSPWILELDKYKLLTCLNISCWGQGLLDTDESQNETHPFSFRLF